MTSYEPPFPAWIQVSVDRVTAQYTPRPRCHTLCWHDGPMCELPKDHDGPHAAPSVANQPGILFVGPVPSSRKGQPPYTVTVYDEPTQRATCTCEGYTKYRKGQDCSHIKLVREALKG